MASAFVIDLVSCPPTNIPATLSCITVLKSGQFTTNQGQIVHLRPPPQVMVIASFAPHSSQVPKGFYWIFQDMCTNPDFFQVPRIQTAATGMQPTTREVPHEFMNDEEFLGWVHKAWRAPDFAFYDRHKNQIKSRFVALAGDDAVCLNIE